MNFTKGDRVIHRNPYFGDSVVRRGAFVAGPGEHETSRPGNTLVIGEEYAVVQFDDGEPGQAQVVRLDDLKPEDPS